MTLDRTGEASVESVALMFLNDFQARTVEAIAERIIPDDGGGNGATEAGVVYYIDRALAGFSTDLQHVYGSGLNELNVYCLSKFSRSFVDLGVEQQDDLIRELLGPEIGEPAEGLMFSQDDQPGGEDSSAASLLPRLFAVIREHTVEGFFCDPAYGGNRNAIGWKLVGFPGAQWGYTSKQMADGFDGRSIPIKTLSDLRADLHNQRIPDNSTFYANEEN